MSKLQRAIHKAATDHKRNKAEVDSHQEAPADPGSDRRVSHSADLLGENRIHVDFDALVDFGVMASEEHKRELRDSMRRIKWPVLANAFGEQRATTPRGNVVMVASATAGEGKTFTTVNLALSIAAEKDYDVLLVDADIAKPRASESFGIIDRAGVIDYLLGEVDDVTDVIVGTDVPGLSLLPAGKSHEHASELIASSRMKEFVAQLNENFPNTVILFDSSPILQTNESQVLSHIVGQVLLVVAANTTSQPAVLEAARILEPENVVNVVFNGMNSFFRHKYRYGGYYGYQSRT